MKLVVILLVALAFVCSADASTDSNIGGDGGGYVQLPQCGPSYYGVTLYVQQHFWRCDHGTPDHWTLIS